MNQVEIQAEAVLTTTAAKVEELPEAVAVGQDVDAVEAECWVHVRDGAEHGLKREFGSARGVLVDVLEALIGWEGYWQGDILPDGGGACLLLVSLY